MDFEDRMVEILIDTLDVEAEDLVPGAVLMTDLGASSVDMVELVAELENTFDIEIDDGDIDRLRTVRGVFEYVREKLG